MKINFKKYRALSLAVSAVVGGMTAPLAHADVTGNINAVSKYVLRGITAAPENQNTSVQGGLDYSSKSGLYAGYWGSNLGYGTTTANGFENDLYGGYKTSAGPATLGVGVIYYAYTNVQDANGAEVIFTGAVGNATLGVNYLTRDLAWGNKGDTYVNAGYTQPLPSDFSLAGSAMYYFYKKDGKFIAETPESKSSAFRGVSVTLSHPLGKTGGTMGITLVGGGKDRVGNYQKLMPVLSLGMTF